MHQSILALCLLAPAAALSRSPMSMSAVATKHTTTKSDAIMAEARHRA